MNLFFIATTRNQTSSTIQMKEPTSYVMCVGRLRHTNDYYIEKFITSRRIKRSPKAMFEEDNLHSHNKA